MSGGPFADMLAERLPELAQPAPEYDGTADTLASWRAYIALCREMHQAGQPLPPSGYLGNGGER